MVASLGYREECLFREVMSVGGWVAVLEELVQDLTTVLYMPTYLRSVSAANEKNRATREPSGDWTNGCSVTPPTVPCHNNTTITNYRDAAWNVAG